MCRVPGAGEPRGGRERYEFCRKALDLAIAWPPHTASTLGDLVQLPGLRLVHQVRANRLQRWLSHCRATASDSWYTARGEGRAAPAGPVLLDLHDTALDFLYQEELERRYRAVFHDRPRVEIEYEDGRGRGEEREDRRRLPARSDPEFRFAAGRVRRHPMAWLLLWGLVGSERRQVRFLGGLVADSLGAGCRRERSVWHRPIGPWFANGFVR